MSATADHASESLQSQPASPQGSSLSPQLETWGSTWAWPFQKKLCVPPGIANHLPKEVQSLLDDADGCPCWSPAADICEWGGGGAQDQAGEGLQPTGEACQWKGGGTSRDKVALFYFNIEGKILLYSNYLCPLCDWLHISINHLGTVHLILRKNSSKGEHQPEEHPGREREGAAGEHGDHPQALLEGQLITIGNCTENFALSTKLLMQKTCFCV